jgi:hypothetical protein
MPSTGTLKEVSGLLDRNDGLPAVSGLEPTMEAIGLTLHELARAGCGASNDGKVKGKKFGGRLS